MSADILHAQIQDFFRGGGVQARWPENSLDNVLFLFFSPQLILQFTEGVKWFYYRENYTFLPIKRGSNIFQGVKLFPGGGGGPNAYFYRYPYNL